MVVIGWILYAFGMARLGVAGFNMASKPYLRGHPGANCIKKVSVLVPARNEESNLETLFQNFRLWRDEVYEFIIYDDMSTDRTLEIASGYAATDSRITIMTGGELPAGWLGKNHACHRLSLKATGDILLFIDADVTLEKEAITRSVSFMQKYGLALLSIFPRQITDRTGSRLCVPLMNWILLSLLPLLAVRWSVRPSLAAANGQFMMFDRRQYADLSPHSRFRGAVAEDIAIIKFYKQKKLNVATLLGRDDVNCRMYDSLREAVDGFSKNIVDFFGGNVLLCLLFVLATTVTPFWLFIHNGCLVGWSYLLVIIAIRIVISLASRQDVLVNLSLSIPQQFMLWVITFKAVLNRKRSKLIWKGRNIS